MEEKKKKERKEHPQYNNECLHLQHGHSETHSRPTGNATLLAGELDGAADAVTASDSLAARRTNCPKALRAARPLAVHLI